MEVKMQYDLSYYDFLNFIHVIGINTNFIQKQNVAKTLKNYDLQQVKKDLNTKIENLNKILKK